MAELKRDFSGAKMNKDMDERVLPSGQYRDANNVQIATSDGSNVGALQTIMGNKEVTDNVVPEDYCTCVGVLPLPEKDLIYYFISGAGHKNYRPLVEKDYIIEYDTITQTSRYVFVDIFSVTDTMSEDNSFSGNLFFYVSKNGHTINKTGIRKGMVITGTFTHPSTSAVVTLNAGHNVTVTDIVADGSNWRIYHNYKVNGTLTHIGHTVGDNIYFRAPNVLQFNPLNKITAINHIDGMIFWTDGATEPKKINIERSLMGTGGTKVVAGWDDGQLSSHANNTGNTLAYAVQTPFGTNHDFHTRLVISSWDGISKVVATSRLKYEPIWAELEHVTVIKKSPKAPLEIEMLETELNRTPDPTGAIPNPPSNLTYSQTGDASGNTSQVKWTDSNGDPLTPSTVINNFYFADPVDFRNGDVVIFTNDATAHPQYWEADTAMVRGTISNAPGGAPNNGGSIGPYTLTILAVDRYIPDAVEDWFVRLEDKPSLFEFKFPRFSYRWKYEDGEYSTFAPWTSVAFIPGDFDYLAKKGYNLGMRNKLKTLRLKNYFQEFTLVPRDVVQVDLLYKEEGSPTVYTVKEISEKEFHPEWPDRHLSNWNRGEYTLTSEMIHAVVPSNQMLRPWDNVPKSALAQEMTGNRIVYGNYKQNYDITNKIGLSVSWLNEDKAKSNFDLEIPEKSVKTLRSYQVGIVFADEFGRETPVLVPKEGSTLTLDKKHSVHANRIQAKISYPTNLPFWAKYAKYYIKETSNEYYNLAMDRWYDAEDGNVWLSFPSAERNKVDEETFLILKNEHDGNKAILEEGRYKIIAIENEAPMYVKTEKKSHGTAETINQTGTSLEQLTNILVNDSGATSAWQEAFGSDWMQDVYAKAAPGSIYARIVAIDGQQSQASRWVGVVSIRTLSNTSEKSIKIDEQIGETANAASTMSNPVYSVEIRQDIVRNKPEFDGRFFVKVYKDLLLQQAIMKELDVENNLTIIKSFPMRLIVGGYNSPSNMPHPANPTNTGGYTHTYNSSNYDWVNTWSSPDFNAGSRQGHCDVWQRTKSWWFQAASDWHIDGVASSNYENWGTGSHRYHSGRDNGVHSSHSGGAGPGNGCLRHAATYSRIYFMARQWYADVNSQRKDFYNTMKSVGTIFRFRDDPTLTPYVVTNFGGYSQGVNYRKCSQDHCDTGSGACKRMGFNVQFEKLDGGGPMDWQEWDPLSTYKHDARAEGSEIDILQMEVGMGGAGGSSMSTEEPAIWETEPKEDIGLDIYYEASGSFPLDVDHTVNELLIPLGSTFTAFDSTNTYHTTPSGDRQHYKITAVNANNNGDLTDITFSTPLQGDIPHDKWIYIERYDGTRIILYVSHPSSNYSAGATTISVVTGRASVNTQSNAYQPFRAPHYQYMALGFHNCWQFGNGIESDRIRDDYNAPQLTNGVKASTVLAEPYAEEHRSSGLIWSGIFNSTSGINNLNQFIQAEPITKDLNPSYGSLQKLVARNTDTLAFCEDKVLRLLTNKDALYNADGSSNVTASNAVIGQSTPIQGDYGISTNPESLALTPHGMYWCDQMRGQVLHLEGGTTIRNISDIGMKDYFNDTLQDVSDVIGTYDDKKQEYNISIGKKTYHSQIRSTKTTISFNELTKGWVSFKSFGPEHGVSLNNEYYTFNEGSMWQHHTNTTANNFYNTQYYSDVTLIFNDQPGSVKSFGSINYEGTQARITQFTTDAATGLTDKEYYNLTAKEGWYTETLNTNLQEIENLEFKNKEGKWFSTIKGVATTLSNLDEEEFSVQGLGSATTQTVGPPSTPRKIYMQPNTTDAAGSAVWDSTPDDTTFLIINPSQNVGMSNAAIGAGSIDGCTITNMVPNNSGVPTYSGVDLDAADFSVEGGTLSTSGAGNSTVYTWTAASGWNADTEAAKVEFTNNGIANDPGNTINVKGFYDAFTMPASGDKFIYYDVDYSGRTSPPPPNNVYRESCVHVSYPIDVAGKVDTLATVTPNDTFDGNITVSDNVQFLSGNQASSMQSDRWGLHQVLEGQTTKIAEYTVTADAGQHLSAMGQTGKGVEVSWFSRLANADWEPYYSWTVTDTNYTTSGNTNKKQSSFIEIFYTPPVGVTGLDPDPVAAEGNFCAFLHDIRLSWQARPIITTSAKLTSVGLSSNTSLPGQSVNITMNSNAAGKAKVAVVKMNNDNTASTHTYNWSTSAFVSIGEGGVVTKEITFDGSSKIPYQESESFNLPTTDENARYCVIMSASSTEDALTLASTVPNAINELNLEVLRNTGTATFTPGTKVAGYTGTALTSSGSTTILTAPELSTSNANYNFTFTYTKANEGDTMVLFDVPKLSDITGFDTHYKVADTPHAASGTTTIHINDTTGIKTGMSVSDRAFVDGDTSTNRVVSGCTVSSVLTDDSIALSNAITGNILLDEHVTLSSDWDYELVSANATINEAATVVTVTGVLKIKKYGRITPNGDIVLQPNFITMV
tara:strand:- start:6865 stop:14208 length:7344 start_codon:yes stop_codon:yes gene_type:complete